MARVHWHGRFDLNLAPLKTHMRARSRTLTHVHARARALQLAKLRVTLQAMFISKSFYRICSIPVFELKLFKVKFVVKAE